VSLKSYNFFIENLKLNFKHNLEDMRMFSCLAAAYIGLTYIIVVILLLVTEQTTN